MGESWNDSMCFACSPHNPIGLRLKFTDEGGICRAFFAPGKEHQGWSGYLHGGLIATLLDEAMAQWLWRRGVRAMTAEMLARFSYPVPVGTRVAVEAELVAHRGRLWELAARVVLPDGKVAARARGKFLAVEKAAGRQETV